ncbi:MAG TPA: universal stress protein [Gemmatimonadota bacterium]|nr:universal stress protein [Gemmatimonadota bacterium]
MTIREVLWPTDLSECAEAALAHAVAWTRRHGARLHALHVAVFDARNPSDPAHHLKDPDTMWADMQGFVDREVREALARAGALDLDVRSTSVRGDGAAEAILEHAAEADLVVMGTHGRRGFRSLLIGSVTEQVIRESERPVLVVRQRQPAEPAVPPSRILVPIDFSGAAAPAVRIAREIAERSRGSLLVLHVIEDVIVPDFYFPAAPMWLDYPELRETAEARLRDTFTSAGGPTVPVEYRVMPGRAVLDIPRFAGEWGADLIVLPTHGLGGVERLLLGSTADKVLRRASCPVLVLPGRVLARESLEAGGRSEAAEGTPP